MISFFCQENQIGNFIINLLLASSGAIFLATFGIFANFLNLNIPTNSRIWVVISFISLFWASQANSFPSLIHNNLVWVSETISTKSEDKKIIINEFKQSLDQKLQDLILLYDHSKFDSIDTQRKAAFLRVRLSYLIEKSMDTDTTVKDINTWYFKSNKRKNELKKNIDKIKVRLKNYNAKREFVYTPELLYIEFNDINKEEISPNYQLIFYSLDQFYKIISNVNSSINLDTVHTLDCISLQVVKQFDQIDLKLRPTIVEVRFREKLLDSKEVQQRIIEDRLAMFGY